MEEFKYYIDRQVTCREREVVYVDAETKEEADELITKAARFGSDYIDCGYTEFEILYDTITNVTGENEQPVVEVLDADTNLVIYKNE